MPNRRTQIPLDDDRRARLERRERAAELLLSPP